jgi:hypothetical protein
MTAKYQAGTFTHEVDLWKKITDLMLSAGWTVQATIADGYDKVFTSTGEDGYAINYLRVAARKQDEYRENFGYSQRLDSDGYSGFVNFFAYQFFPTTGTSSADGYSEIGRMGPILYVIDQDSVGDIRRINLITSTAASPRVTDHSANIGFWPDRDAMDQAFNSGGARFDGSKFIYFQHDLGQLRRYNVSTGTTTFIQQPINRFIANGFTQLKSTDRYYLLGLTNNGTAGFQSILFEFNFNDVLTSSKFIADPPWASSSHAPRIVGYDRYFYAVRGASSTNFARYDILTNTWTSLTSTNLPNVYSGASMVFVTRQQTGLSKHRIYLLTGNSTNSLRYINVEDDGSILDASWTIATGAPFSSLSGSQPGFEWDGYDGIFYNPGEGGSTLNEFYRYNISTGTWTLVDSNFMPQDINDVCTLQLHNGLQSRVRAENNKPGQKYWLFVDKDRIITITKDASGFYTYCYAGAIESYYDITTKAITTSSVSAGAGVVIPVNNTSRFTIGEKVQIQGVAPTDFFTHVGLDNRTRKFIRTEHFTISAINAGVSITATSLNGNYSAGSRIASDIQNTILTVEGTRWAQALNKPNTTNSFASGDQAEQMYLVQPAVSTTQTALTDLNDRTGQFILWPFVVSSENLTNYSGKEVRGQLKGVFVAGSGTGASEDVIEINGQQYIMFSIARQEDTRFFVFGPVV